MNCTWPIAHTKILLNKKKCSKRFNIKTILCDFSWKMNSFKDMNKIIVSHLIRATLHMTSDISLSFFRSFKMFLLYPVDGRILYASVSNTAKPDFELYLIGGRILYASVSSRRADTVWIMFKKLIYSTWLLTL